jgi:predicted DNA-binding protein (MmcQ/YjbR family)
MTPTTARKQLGGHALKLPHAWADEPWPGDHVAKVGKKIFVFLGGEGPDVSVGVKLPRSLLFARPDVRDQNGLRDGQVRLGRGAFHEGR